MKTATVASLTLCLTIASVDVTLALAGAQGTLDVVDETPIILPPEPGVMEGTWYNSAAVLHGSRWILYLQGHDDCPWMFDTLYYSISDTGPEGPWSHPSRLTPCSQAQPNIPPVELGVDRHVFGIGGVIGNYFGGWDLLTINYGVSADANLNFFYYGKVANGRLEKGWFEFLDSSLIGSEMSIADPVPVALTSSKFGFIFTYQDRRFFDGEQSLQFRLGYGVHDWQQKKTWVETTSHGWLQVGAPDGYRIPVDTVFRPINTEYRMDVNQASISDAGSYLRGYALYPARQLAFRGDFRQRQFRIAKNTFRWLGFTSIYFEYKIPNQGAPGCVPSREASFPTGVGADWFYSVDYYCDGSEFGHRAVVHGRVQPR